MKIVALDSKEEYQVIKDSIKNLTSQISYRNEVDILMYYIENHIKIDSLGQDITDRILSAYLEQDISFSLNLNKQQQEELNLINNELEFLSGNENFNEERNKLIIDERNNYWIKKIPSLLEESSCFIAVGAGHLSGEKGLINQLRNLNYTVVPIN